MSSTTSPALPAFSYAQAAKGLAPSASAPHNAANVSGTPSTSSSRERKSSSAEPAKLDLTSKATNSQDVDLPHPSAAKSAHTVRETTSTTTTNEPLKENIQGGKLSGSSGEETKVNVSGTSSPSFGAASTSTLSKEEDISITPNDASDNWDKQSQVSTSVEKSAQTTGGSKVPDAEDDWEKEPVSKMPSEKELKAAPIPAVNFWQARQEAQEAKAKALAAQRPAQVTVKAKPQPATTAEGQKPTDEESRRKQPGKPSAKPEKDNGAVKRNKGDAVKPRDEGRRQQTRPPGSGTQATEPMEHSNPPPVGDAESWPTPETAISDERKKATQERPEKPESKNGTPKPHSTKWVPIPYVPSTKFITPLPLAATRRGGRPAIRGGPEAAAEPGASASQPNTPSGKNDTAGSMGPPPLPKKASDQERGRNQESSGASRANSVPTQSRRATSTGAASAEQRTFSGTFNKERAGLNNRTNASLEQQAPTDTLSKNESTMASSQRSDSKAYPGPTDPAVSTPRRGSLETSRQPNTAGEAHSHPRYEASTRRSIPANFYTNSDIFSNQDPGSAAEKSKETVRPRDYSKDKPESSREKVASWRDREVSYDKEGREFRPERTRGSYRGRGAPSTYGVHSTSTHPSTAPLPQQPFGSGKSNSFHNSSRQNSHPYSGLSSQSNQRGNVRSQSIPATALYTTMTNQNPSIGPPLSPIHTDMPVYAYQPPMHAGFMSAVPYNAALDSYALLAMVHGQLEYYFSIDNLCKDMYLRSNMDSQGYVLLSVIADFKRIKALTEDMDLLRHVCGQLKSIEYRPGEDGVDRLRRKEGWKQWVRPMNERVPSAQNEGPPPGGRPSVRKQGSNEQYRFNGPSFSALAFRSGSAWSNDAYREGFANGQALAIPPNVANVDAPISETPMNTAIPNLLPERDIPSSKENGHDVNETLTAEDPNPTAAEAGPSIHPTNGSLTSSDLKHVENVFPDEKISELKVIVLENDPASPPFQPPFVTAGSRTFSHGSIDGQTLSSDLRVNASTSSTVSGLRGGSGSTEQLERSSSQLSTHPAQVARWSYHDGNMPVFWNKDGAQLIESAHDGVAWEPYDSLRNRALEQRLYGDTSATMESLYKFWSHFLIRNFNVRMYDEFHALALEDSSQRLNSGVSHLVRYYEALLSGQNPLTDRHANDLVQLVQSESDGPRPAFQILRTAWRNGAFNLKSRKRIDTIITPTLRAELEK